MPKRTEFRPVTDWPHRIDILIRQSQSAMAFGAIFDAGFELGERERSELAFQALNELAARTEISRMPANSHKQTKEASEKAGLLRDAAIDNALDAVQDRLAYQVIYSDLQALKDYLESSQWGQAANRAQVRLLHSDLTDDPKAVFEEVSRAGRRLHVLDLLQASLREAQRNRDAAETSNALHRLDLELFSPKMELLVRRWRALADLRTAAEVPWQRPPSVQTIRHCLKEFSANDTSLAAEIEQDLAAKLLLDGFPTEARELLPFSGPSEHAELLLNDLTAAILGNGDVRSPAIRHVISAPDWNNAGKPPMGMRPFLPSAERAKWRPPQRPSSSAKSRPLQRLGTLERVLLDEIRAELSSEKETALDGGADALARIRVLLNEHKRDEEDDQRSFVDLESLVQRKLGSVDRYVARHMRRQGSKNSDIASVLAGYPVVADPAAFEPQPPLDLRMILPEQHALYLSQLLAAGAVARPAIVLAIDWAMLTEVGAGKIEP